ncbi:hypothetical protein GM921_09425 [Pedobacter sp. LMG 31464]|uniref:Uncharacterized protein n=1 Tax=Pedobacter planticolens TaxID=2679964 RepID=A0A923DYZ0_9SPHI|nr:hypothetical protein [Pedobacter planticolens]MBB2145705.1 hypothetical protein [Pedobacter planticolens]
MIKAIRINHLLKTGFLFAIAVYMLSPKLACAQNNFEKELKKKMDSLIAEKGPLLIGQTMLPNNGIQSLMTPSAWGSYGTYAFGVLGSIYPTAYSNKPDLVSAFGLTFGNPEKSVNISASVNVTRVTELRDLSLNLVVNRQIFKASSISVGGVQLFANPDVSDSPDGTYYIAFSHAVQTVRSKRAGYSALGYTIGFGTGRFLHKSPFDIAAGKGKYGTGVFANVSYEVFDQININAEWSGLNLGFSTGVRPIKNNALTLGLGVYNLTKYSGDKVSMLGTLSYPIYLGKRNKNIN